MKQKLFVAAGFVGAVGLAVVISLAAVGKLDLGKFSGWVASLLPGQKADKSASDYSAVFLANGQVYFGKLGSGAGQYVTLTDVFYLRIQQQLQPPADEEETAPRRETQLIKLGEELHGPVDEIRINRDQILFIERMKTDSRVVQGIKKFYEQKK